MKKIQELIHDLNRTLAGSAKLKEDMSSVIGVETIKQVQDNFRKEGFGGRKWAKRKKETTKTLGKKVLSGTSRLKKSVQYEVTKEGVFVGVDLDSVPYAEIHNEGGTVNKKASSFQMPQRQYIGTNTEWEKRVLRAIENLIKRAFKQ